MSQRFYITFFKPTFDWLIALIASIVLLPVFIIVAIAIRIDSPGPVFFIQERLGKNGRIFRIYKFRSMLINQVGMNRTKLFENDPRITSVGSLIRKTSIDELPQLLNILKGEMSFIGPRPPLTYYPKQYNEYNDYERQRFSIKPGISGLAQTRCREEHDWSVNIPVDIEYVQSISFKRDLVIFFVSVTFFLRTDNIYRKENTI